MNRAEFRVWKDLILRCQKMLSKRKKHFYSPCKPNPPVGKYVASHLNVPLAGNVGLLQFVAPVLPL